MVFFIGCCGGSGWLDYVVGWYDLCIVVDGVGEEVDLFLDYVVY